MAHKPEKKSDFLAKITASFLKIEEFNRKKKKKKKQKAKNPKRKNNLFR